MWKYHAILSALFAALNAIFAKVGVRAIDSDLATAIRTAIILLVNLEDKAQKKVICRLMEFTEGCRQKKCGLVTFKVSELQEKELDADFSGCGR